MFNFYYQTGEFIGESGSFLLDLFIEIVGAASGAGIAVYYAFKQYKNQIKDQENGKAKEIEDLYKDKVRYFNHLIDGSEKFGVSLISGIDRILVGFESDIFTIQDLSLGPWDDLSRSVGLVDRELHYHAYKRIIGGEKIQIIFSDLDTLNRTREFMSELYLARYREDSLRKKNILDTIKDVTTFIATAEASEGISQEFINALLEIHNKHQELIQVRGKNFETLRHNYFRLIIAQMGIFLHDAPVDSNISKLYFSILQGDVEIENMIQANSGLRDELINVKQKTSTLLARITQNVSELRVFVKSN